jgi:NAD(P)-dependent dehydrogenase (short-subunit alcohol dehydrogenase family)
MKTTSLFSLKDEYVLITGASGRLGREIAYATAEMGAHLILVGRHTEPLEEVKAHINSLAPSSRVWVMATNLFVPANIEALFKTLDVELPQLNVLFNTVTGCVHKAMESYTPEDTLESLQQGLATAFHLSQEAIKRMSLQQRGSLIHVGSIYGQVAPDQRIYEDSGLNSSVGYAMAKGGLHQLTRYLASYTAQSGIRVNCIAPGGVEDPSNAHALFRKNYASKVPMGRMMARHEIRGAAVFLASDASSYITGQTLFIDGGLTAL